MQKDMKTLDKCLKNWNFSKIVFGKKYDLYRIGYGAPWKESFTGTTFI